LEILVLDEAYLQLRILAMMSIIVEVELVEVSLLTDVP
jgi:hypothetical protein